jgi:hypothetical protein
LLFHFSSLGIPWCKSQLPQTTTWDRFWAYFKNTWLGQYAIEDWNIHGLATTQRTNNPLERHNRELNQEFPVAHPTLVQFADTIKQVSVKKATQFENIRLNKEKVPEHLVPNLEIPQEYKEYRRKFLAQANGQQ